MMHVPRPPPLALQYEVRLTEAKAGSGQEGPTPSRIQLCFEVLGMFDEQPPIKLYCLNVCNQQPPPKTLPTSSHTDEVIPQLGVFQRVMKMLRNELYGE